MNIKRSIKFELEKRKDKQGNPIVENVPIRMRVTYEGMRAEPAIGYRVDISKWDKEKQRVKNGTSNKLKQTASEINSKIVECESDMQTVFKEYEVKEIIPSTKDLIAAFNEKQKKEISKPTKITVVQVFDEFIQKYSIENSLTRSRIKTYGVVKNHLIEFNEKLTFEEVNENMLAVYQAFLLKKKLRNSYVSKQIKDLKTYLRWCKKRKYLKDSSFLDFKSKLKTIESKVIFLTPTELTMVEEYNIPTTKQYLERVRDVLLFCCYTGLRHSDVYNLKRGDIKDGHIEIVTMKTTDSLTIEFNKKSRAILDKYKEIHFQGNKVLPVISNQKMKDYLKELGKLAEINELIKETYLIGTERISIEKPKYEYFGSHLGRRTFICTALALSIPTHVVMEWSGHKSYDAIRPYIGVSSEIRAAAMEKFNTI
ncbi:MAG: tyrosine-type recombinase/integrase [Dysgonomonas sp.]